MTIVLFQTTSLDNILLKLKKKHLSTERFAIDKINPLLLFLYRCTYILDHLTPERRKV